MGKTRPISKNNWYQWYDWDNNIPKSLKNPDNDTSLDYKPKNISDIFKDEFDEYMSEKAKKSSMNVNLCKMYSKSDHRTIMIGNNTNEIIQELFHSLVHKYQIGLEQSMRGSNFIFDYVSGIHYIHKYNKPQPWWTLYRFSWKD